LRVKQIKLAIFIKYLAIEKKKFIKKLAIVIKYLAIEKKKSLGVPYFKGADVTKKNSDNILISYVVLITKTSEKNRSFIWLEWKRNFEKKQKGKKMKSPKKKSREKTKKQKRKD
jgi:hypothetical protein